MPTFKGWGDRQIILGLTVVALCLFCFNLGNVPLRDWDEGTRALVAREIFRTGNWLHPTQFGEPYLNKPPLMDWLVTLSYRLGGVNEWTSRLPGAIASALGVPLLYCLGKELFAEKQQSIRAALLSASVYLTLLPVVRHGRLLMLDGLVLTAMILSFWCFLKAEKQKVFGLGIGVGFGIITFTKGLLVLPIVAIALLFSLRDKRWQIIKNFYLWLGCLIGFLPVIWWYWSQINHYGQIFIDVHFLSQGIDRVSDTVENHQHPPWFYILEIAKYTAPWLFFLPQSYRLIWQEQYEKHGQLILGGSMFYGFLISTMGTKLPWYIMPIYPFMALAVGYYLSGFDELRSTKYYRFPFQYCFYFLSILTALSAIYFVFTDPQTSLILMSLAIAAMFGIAGWYWQRKSQNFITTFIVGMYATLGLLFCSTSWLWEVNEAFPVKQTGEIIRTQTPETTKLFTTFGYSRPSLDFYGDRQILPANLDDIQTEQYWLVDHGAFEANQQHFPEFEILGQSETFKLIHTKKET
ncbi:glycosyl transferase family 39 [[Leptolyngbya] sp. PCC 7376]|uniref:ArnT family glycosyltransferase n=1 Tax=[Leptolyngbya] sp. PCC 7376 TaxID=111781 RepID=UPI00029F4DA2|nr:glycosyltransferase family 39 protein [[Leptolyngbya] sp. PCC 7376]AFY37155.1 glycosyl transferase family 39 [[Leptolyngbya] sp. PCC 7376]